MYLYMCDFLKSPYPINASYISNYILNFSHKSQTLATFVQAKIEEISSVKYKKNVKIVCRWNRGSARDRFNMAWGSNRN